MTERVRWGIVSTGHIAGVFAEALSFAENAELAAVASRDLPRAKSFADRFSIPKAYGTYKELAADPNVDIVYIASPHAFHLQHATLCLNRGKHVLCEKPMAMNYEEAKEMVRVARRNKLFLCEAMWTRFFPAVQEIKNALEKGELGSVHLLQANFGFAAAFDSESRLFAKNLGGGALLDIGVYPLHFADVLFGTPDVIVADGRLGPTAVDHLVTITLRFASGIRAQLAASIDTQLVNEAHIYGGAGHIHVPARFYCPTEYSLTKNGVANRREFPYENGYAFQAVEVGKAVINGHLESTFVPLERSLSVMRAMDEIRRQIGVTYATD